MREVTLGQIAYEAHLQETAGDYALQSTRQQEPWQRSAEAVLAAASEREAGLAALVERLRESIDRIMTGGNHLASALIGILGAGNDTFPPYSTDYEQASKVISDPNHRDLWMCWKIIMLERDALAWLTPPAALDELRRREREAADEEKLRQIARMSGEEGLHEAVLNYMELAAKVADAIAAERKEGE